jgi:hypothetical protein
VRVEWEPCLPKAVRVGDRVSDGPLHKARPMKSAHYAKTPEFPEIVSSKIAMRLLRKDLLILGSHKKEATKNIPYNGLTPV